MPFPSSKVGHPWGLALAGVVVATMFCASAPPVLAGDDGQAPIWSGIGGLVGLTGKDKDEKIDYRERARLVLPPKMDLPPPGTPPDAPNPQSTAAWPLDPDVAKVRKEKDDSVAILKSQSNLAELRDGHRLTQEQLRADRSPPGQTRSADRCAVQNNTRTCTWVPFHNVLENFGLAKADDVVAGQEPDRDWLTDPPPGYRRPTANTTATFDEKKKNNDRDPRAAFYHPPDQ